MAQSEFIIVHVIEALVTSSIGIICQYFFIYTKLECNLQSLLFPENILYFFNDFHSCYSLFLECCSFS